MLTNCFTCDQPISEKARFCSKCGTNVRCKNCSEDLAKGDVVCEVCGQDVVTRQVQSTTVPLNHIKYNDIKKGISLDALVTDTFGANAAAVVGVLRGNQMLPNPPVRASKSLLNDDSQEELGTSAQEVTEAGSTTIVALPPKSSGLEVEDAEQLLSSLFELRDEKWFLINPELKASSKSDFVKRAICLFLQFQNIQNIRQVPRADVITLLRNCSAWDANARDIISKTKSYIQASSSHLTLTLPGVRYANDVLAEAYNDEVPNVWIIGTTRKSPRKAGKKIRNQEPDQAEAE